MATCETPPIPDKSLSGDNYYGPFSCWPEFQKWAWDAYSFDEDYWDDGFGYGSPCDTDEPLGRTLNALYLLNYSAQDPLDESYSKPILNWAPRFVREEFDNLRAACGDGMKIANTFRIPWIYVRIELYLGFFYQYNVVKRAGTLVHEARHADGKGHDAQFPPWSGFIPGNGADSSWEYQGAWMFNSLYLASFGYGAQRAPRFLRASAIAWANFIITNAFATMPDFLFAPLGPVSPRRPDEPWIE